MVKLKASNLSVICEAVARTNWTQRWEFESSPDLSGPGVSYRCLLRCLIPYILLGEYPLAKTTLTCPVGACGLPRHRITDDVDDNGVLFPCV